jgi:hypothetical protein
MFGVIHKGYGEKVTFTDFRKRHPRCVYKTNWWGKTVNNTNSVSNGWYVLDQQRKLRVSVNRDHHQICPN